MNSNFSADNAPSKVLHVRNVSPDTSHEELISFVSQFGTVTAICFLSKFSQALVEMDTLAAASAVVVYNRSNPTFIRGREVHFSYSKSQHINTSQAQQGSTTASISSHNILLCTILNPLFNINVDVMHAIMSPYGNVQRIVIFNKNGVQALVEFDNPATAAEAKTALDGKDIYAGSCTLKIEFSKAEKLNVHNNNDKSRDYTNPNLPAVSGHQAQQQQMLQAFGDPYAAYRGMMGMGMGAPGMGMPSIIPPMGMGFDASSRSVLIVYGLDDNALTVDKLFNLFCQYGNVLKIKILTNKKGSAFLTNKKGSALVQMGDNVMADQALQNLQAAVIHGQPLQVQYSKHPFIADSRAEQTAEGAAAPTNTSKDFSSSPLNRFTHNPNAFRHIYRPSTTLYFSNAPKDFQDKDLIQLFTNLNAQPPTTIKFFTLNNTNSEASERSRVGLMEFPDAPTATESLITANNTKINNYPLRLSFSSNSIHSNQSLNTSQGISAPQ